jgi:exosortase
MTATLRTATTPNPVPPPARQPPVRRPPALFALLADAASRPETRPAIVGAGVGLVLIALTFYTNLRHFFISWSTDENYSHGFLVPLISLYFANLAAERGPVPIRGGVRLGLTVILVAVLAKMATILGFGTLGDIALIATLIGLCAVLAGIEAVRRYWFAFAFLLFMIPLPVALYARIASPLQLMVSQIASVALNATGVPVLTEGNMMTLPGGIQMFVAEACSGMRQLTGFLALTAAVAYLTPRPPWYRLGLIGSAVPIAMTANVARVILTGYIMFHVNPHYASGAYHTLEGLIMLGFGLSLLRAECWLLDQVVELSGPAIAPAAGGPVPPPEGPAPGPIEPDDERPTPPRHERPALPPFVGDRLGVLRRTPG